MKFRELARLAVILATAAVTASAFAAPVKVATEASFPPFSKTEADGSYAGFEIDLGNEVCKRAGLECEWVKQDFDGMIAGLLARKFDMIFSSMSIKPEREGRRLLDSLLHRQIRVLRQEGLDQGLRQRCQGQAGRRYAGATQDQYVRKYYAGVMEPVGYENADQIHADLVNGRIDLAFNEQLPAKDFMAKPEGQAFEVIRVIEDPEVLGKGVGAMFRKGVRSRPRSMRRSVPSMPMAR